MRIVMSYRTLYRMSEQSYRTMLKEIASGRESPTFKQLKAKKIGQLMMDVTDLTRLDAEVELVSLKKKRACTIPDIE